MNATRIASYVRKLEILEPRWHVKSRCWRRWRRAKNQTRAARSKHDVAEMVGLSGRNVEIGDLALAFDCQAVFDLDEEARYARQRDGAELAVWIALGKPIESAAAGDFRLPGNVTHCDVLSESESASAVLSPNRRHTL